MGVLKSAFRDLVSWETSTDLGAAFLILMADLVFQYWGPSLLAASDPDQAVLSFFSSMMFMGLAVFLLRLISRGVAHTHPGRWRFLHRLAALSNRTVMFGALPLVAAVFALLALPPLSLSISVWGGWLVQLCIVCGVAAVQTVSHYPFLPTPAEDGAPRCSWTAGSGHRMHYADPPGSWLALAACAVLAPMLLGTGEVLSTPYMMWTTLPVEAHSSVHRTQYMPNGDRLTLLPGSVVRVRYSLRHREVQIDRGGAYIEACACNHRKIEISPPQLTVRSGAATVSITTGGRPVPEDMKEVFIRRFNETTQVLVAQGNDIELSTSTAQAAGSSGPAKLTVQTLKPQKLAVVTPVSTEVQEISFDDARDRLAWLGGQLAFRGRPLAEVLAEVNLFADRQLEIRDPAIATVPVQANLLLGDVPDLAQRLVVALEREGHVRRTPEEHPDDPIGLVAFDADPARYGPVDAQISADFCASYRGAHDFFSYTLDPTEPDPRMTFNLAGCDVSTAMAGFAQQTGLDYEMVTPPIGSTLTHPLKGTYSLQQALTTMLNGTGCHATGNVHAGIKIDCARS